MLYVVKDMKLGVNLLEGDRAGWFEENLRKEISDDRNSRFWFDPWVNGITHCNHIGRLFEVAEVKNKLVVEMIGDEEGIENVNWSWQVRLFR
jgi:hypothetical protein